MSRRRVEVQAGSRAAFVAIVEQERAAVQFHDLAGVG